MSNAFELKLGKDANGVTTYELSISSYKIIANMPADTSIEVTVPLGYSRAFFSYEGAPVLVDFFNNITGAPGSAFVETTTELRPPCRYGFVGGSSIYLYAIGGNSIVNILFYK